MRAADGACQNSQSRSNEMGIFQGGSLSCILYLLFSNDLSMHVPDGVSIVQFADDTQLLVSGPKAELSRLIALMETALSTLYQWFCNNSMKVNAAKTQMMVLGTPGMLRNLPTVTLSFCGSTVQDEKSVKDLGVIIDRHLNFQEHVDSVSRKCTGILMALSHARHVIPRSVLPNITQALVTAIIRYCLSVYGSCGATQLHRVQKMLNFCARVVTGRKKRDHISDAFSQLRWLNATELVEYHVVCCVQRTIVTGYPHDLLTTIGERANRLHSHDTRRSNSLSLPRIRNEAGRRRLNWRGVKMLNECNIDPHAPAFSSNLKKLLLARRDRPPP